MEGRCEGPIPALTILAGLFVSCLRIYGLLTRRGMRARGVLVMRLAEVERESGGTASFEESTAGQAQLDRPVQRARSYEGQQPQHVNKLEVDLDACRCPAASPSSFLRWNAWLGCRIDSADK